MSQYVKTNWKKGDTVSSERMNKIENELETLNNLKLADLVETATINPNDAFNMSTFYTNYDAIIITISKNSKSALLGLYHYDATKGGNFTTIYNGEDISIQIDSRINSYAGFTITNSSTAT